MEFMRYTVLIEQGEDGFLIGEVAELPGCRTQGKTQEEVLSRIKEAIRLYRDEIKTPPIRASSPPA
jgi:predicted RNase H-like HicB family nuclease